MQTFGSAAGKPAETTAESSRAGERKVGEAMLRGLRNRCPACGEAHLFRAFLKPVERCEACHSEMHHHRADDLPPYLVIFIVGHLVVGGYMATDMVWPMSSWAYLAIWTPITVLASFLLLQPLKGAVIGLQWAMRMHGFGTEHEDPALAAIEKPGS